MDREPGDIGRNTPGAPERASAAQRALGAFCCVVLTGIPCCPVAAASDATNDSLLSLHGLTLYGTLDIGLQYQTHAAPTSAYFPGGSADFVQKNDREAVFGVTPNNWGPVENWTAGPRAPAGKLVCGLHARDFFQSAVGTNQRWLEISRSQ